MIIAGIDYSMTSPCICIFSFKDATEKFDFSRCRIEYLTDTKKYQNTFYHNVRGRDFEMFDGQTERFDSISGWAVDLLIGCDSIGLEGYAYGASGQVFHIAENTGVLKYKLHQLMIPLSVYPPSMIKKFATGKGNASKDQMYEYFVRDTSQQLCMAMGFNKLNIDSPVSDIVDAYFICKYHFEQVKKEL